MESIQYITSMSRNSTTRIYFFRKGTLVLFWRDIDWYPECTKSSSVHALSSLSPVNAPDGRIEYRVTWYWMYRRYVSRIQERQPHTRYWIIIYFMGSVQLCTIFGFKIIECFVKFIILNVPSVVLSSLPLP